MSINKISTMKNLTAKLSNKQYPTAFVRNPDWPTNPAIVSGVQKFTGLFAVFDHSSNFVSIKASGNYTVDWGDGTTPDNTSAGVKTDHNFVYANVSGNPVGTSNAVAVTFTDSGDLVNYTAHPFGNGQVVNFAFVVGTTGISNNTKYYIINSTTNNFQISTSFGGSAVALTTDGVGVIFIPEYKVAVVTLTPQAGQNLTALDLQAINSNLSGYQVMPWLDISMNSSYLSSVNLYSFNTPLISLEIASIGENVITNFSNMFNDCRSLQSIPIMNTASGTNFTYTFLDCFSLPSVPTLNTASGTNFTGTFFDCYLLQSVPLLNTSAATNTSYMFCGCQALQSIPILNTANVTNFSNMFSSCNVLQSVPLLNTGAGTDFSNMFYGCNSLQTIPLLNTGAGANFSNMFLGCSLLKTIPLLNTGAGTNFSNMFWQCTSLETIPLLNTANGTNFSSMFQDCNKLQSVPLLNTSAGLLFTSMFSQCFPLKTIPLLNTGAGTDFSNMFQGCKLLKTIPLLNTVNGTNFTYMVGSCSSLQTIPLLNTASCTDFSNMFNDCSSLQSVPPLNTSAALPGDWFSGGMTGMFYNCKNLTVGALNGTIQSIDYSGCKLSSTQLDAIYTALGTVTGGETIDVTGNYGVSGSTPSIATAKGWTVIG